MIVIFLASKFKNMTIIIYWYR